MKAGHPVVEPKAIIKSSHIPDKVCSSKCFEIDKNSAVPEFLTVGLPKAPPKRYTP